jgi:hypothetical protein
MCLTFAAWTSWTLAADTVSAMSLEQTQRSGTENVILIDNAGKRHALTHFKQPTEIWACELSPDERYALVWHMSYPPLRISIYRTDTRKRVSQFVPGYGGGLSWTKDNTILHSWGCGTECNEMAVYDVHGKTIAEVGFSGFDESPDQQFFVTYSSVCSLEGSPIRIRETASLREVCSTEQPTNTQISDVTWKGDGQAMVTVVSCDAGDTTEVISINFKDGCVIERK